MNVRDDAQPIILRLIDERTKCELERDWIKKESSVSENILINSDDISGDIKNSLPEKDRGKKMDQFILQKERLVKIENTIKAINTQLEAWNLIIKTSEENVDFLDLSQMGLTELPIGIFFIKNLKSLDLSKNKLKQIPREINQLINLTSLNLSHNNIITLPIELTQLANLTFFDISDNELILLPPKIGRVTNLTSLNISGNRLAVLPPEIGQLTNLTSLNLSDNKLRTLPPEISQLVNLTFLDLSSNSLSPFPVVISKLKKLQYLNLYSTIPSIPLVMQTKTNDPWNLIAYCLIKTSPVDLEEISHLESLDLSKTGLTELPSEIGQLINLTSLNLSDNKLRTLPPEISQLVNLTFLDLSSNPLSPFPVIISKLKKLQYLNLYSTIPGIPLVMQTKTNDPWNLIAYCLIKMSPVALEEISHLESLDLSKTGLTELPSEIGQLTNLTSLNLSDNKLRMFPPEISQLVNLTSLDISRNQLNSLSADIGKLINLVNLDLSENHIISLPAEIGKLNNLESLILSKNKINTPPSKFRSLPNLHILDLRENRLPIPPEILEKIKSPNVIINYVSQTIRPMREAKVLIVGQGSVGKTSLVLRIFEDIYNPNESKTQGINIRKHPVRAGDAIYTVNTWDFGGQEIMHATHQFFLTKRSLYLLVLDSRLTQEENRVEYWLKIIQSFGGDSPVLIVGNKTDQHQLDIDRSGLQKKYPNIVGIVESSAATGKGIKELKTAIAAQVVALPHVHDIIPETWFFVKTILEDMGQIKNYLTHDEYLTFCIENEILDEPSQRTLIGFLHDLGIVLHFQDDARLEALGILNPQWVTSGVYKILNSHDLFQNKGVLARAMLDTILDSPDYPANKRLFIIDMMRKFEQCYDIDPDKTFLVPDLLPKDEPFTGEWDSSLAFQYHYNVLPSSIISRFIVRMNPYIHKTVWRSGVVLKKGGNTALVKADTEERKIYIYVNGDGPTRRDFLSAIRVELEAIHKTIIKIEAAEKVPHPDFPELVLDYSELLQFERDEFIEFPKSVNGKTILVNVRRLLNGVRTTPDNRREGSATYINVGNDFKGNLTIGEENRVTNTIPKTKLPAPKSTFPAQKKPLPLRILLALCATFPRIIGRALLEIFGRDKASDTTYLIAGYILIFCVLLVLMGFLDGATIISWFKDTWRFFFPVK